MAVGLQLAGRNEFVKVQENINDNLTKLDNAIDFNLLATLGIEYGGILNNTGTKIAGKAYYDTTGKKLYKCIVNTSIDYADAGFFEALSNNDLLNNFKPKEVFRIPKNSIAERVFTITDERIKKSNYITLGLGRNLQLGGLTIIDIELHKFKTQYIQVVLDEKDNKCRYDVVVNFYAGSIEFCKNYALPAGTQYNVEIPHLTTDIIFWDSPFHSR